MKRIASDIKERTFSRIYLLFGEEAYLKGLYLKNLLAALDCGEDSMNYTRLSGRNIRESDIIDACETLPFFAERRVVLAEDTGFFTEKTEKLADYLKNIPDYCVLIFSEREADKRGKLYKACAKYDRAVEFAKADENSIRNFILSRLKKEGKAIRKSTMETLMDYCTDDLAAVNSELDKLLSYTADRQEITPDDIAAVCTVNITGRIFEMVEAVAAKNREKALSEYYSLLALKEPPMRILYMLGREFNQLRMVKELAAEGLGRDAIAARLSIHPFAVKKAIPLAGRYPSETLLSAAEDFAAMEESVKTGRISDRLSVELMIVKYT